MNKNFLTKTVLFRGIGPDEAEAMLDCLRAREEAFKKNEVIYRMGTQVEALGLVLSGSVRLESDDVWGNKTILDNIGAGQVFAETYACIPGEPLMVNVVAAEKCEILFLNMRKLFTTCKNACGFHHRLMRNLLTVTAGKNLNLTRKIFHSSPKSIRGKLLSYLSFQAIRQGSCRFEIPFNRQQLADYLGVDRSAMSNELSKMKREGILSYEKNSFFIETASMESGF